jgi:hypothetical protein
MTNPAAVGSKAILGLGIEPGTLGFPSIALKTFDWDAMEVGRHSKEDPNTAITGFGGRARGTPGDIDYGNGPKGDLTVLRFLMHAVAEYGSASAITDLGAGAAFLTKIRPGRSANASRSLTVALRESPYYSSLVEHGRRVGDITLTDAPNKRVKMDPTLTLPSGDSISGFPLFATGNAGTFNGALIATRGRRPNDSNWTAGKSIYFKVISATTTTVVFKAAYDTKSVLQDGTDFPVVSFGAATFTVTAGQWARVIDSNDALASPIGLFGENYEPFELTVGDQAGGDLSALFAADDMFEVTATLQLTKTPIAENRLSTYHLSNAQSDESFAVESQTTKLIRPYAPFVGSGSRFATRMDETGDIQAQVTFSKTLFDRMYRDILDRVETFPMLQSYLFGTPVVAGNYEGIEIFYPAMQVTDVKADVPNKNVLKEQVTLEATQPESTPSLPTLATTTFDATVDYPFQINVVSVVDPTPYIGAAV